MDYGSSPVTPDPSSGSPFDIQGFKNLLDTLRQSKERLNDKVKPLPDLEEQ